MDTIMAPSITVFEHPARREERQFVITLRYEGASEPSLIEHEDLVGAKAKKELPTERIGNRPDVLDLDAFGACDIRFFARGEREDDEVAEHTARELGEQL